MKKKERCKMSIQEFEEKRKYTEERLNHLLITIQSLIKTANEFSMRVEMDYNLTKYLSEVTKQNISSDLNTAILDLLIILQTEIEKEENFKIFAISRGQTTSITNLVFNSRDYTVFGKFNKNNFVRYPIVQIGMLQVI